MSKKPKRVRTLLRGIDGPTIKFKTATTLPIQEVTVKYSMQEPYVLGFVLKKHNGKWRGWLADHSVSIDSMKRRRDLAQLLLHAEILAEGS